MVTIDIPTAVNASCVDLNNSQIISWGPCFKELVFFGDVIIAVLFFYLLFGVIVYKSRLPMVVTLPGFLLLNWGLYLMDPNILTQGMLTLAAIIIAIWLVYGLVFKALIK